MARAALTVIAGTGGVTVDTATPDTPCWVAIEDGRIVETGVGRYGTSALDLGDVILAPGFVDLQVNGVRDIDFGAPSEAGWRAGLETLATEGTTACLPTLVSRPRAEYDAVLEVAEAVCARPSERAAVAVGVHLEGPFLGARPGAHDPTLLGAADMAWLRELLDRVGVVKLVTLAPEADDDFETTRELARRGVVVSFGHTGADYDTVLAGVAAGATMATHLFNGMKPPHHRAPGPVVAALEALSPAVIADLEHVHPAMLRLAHRASDRLLLVSDRVCERGLMREGGAMRLADGTLAGSATSMSAALANLVGAGVPLSDAVAMASTRPASLLGDDSRGRLVAGTRGDLVALVRRDLAVGGVWISGRQVG